MGVSGFWAWKTGCRGARSDHLRPAADCTSGKSHIPSTFSCFWVNNTERNEKSDIIFP